MKVFLISNMYPARANPMYGVFVRNIMEGLIRNGAIISAQALINKRPKGLIQYISSYIAYSVHGVFGLFKKFDVIYCHYVLHNAPLALIIQFISRKPLVVNVHGTDMLGVGLAARLLGLFRKLLLKRADLIVVPSQFMMQRTIELTKLSNEKFFISPSGGIQLPKTNLGSDGKSAEIVFGYVGRVVANKGIFILLEALGGLAKSDNTLKWTLLVAGGGPDETLFLETAKEYGIYDKIIWKGILPQEELACIYSQMTALIFPTLLEESLGLVGLEAMACGTPVIGSKIGGLQDYIIDKENGFLFQPGDDKTLTHILSDLCLNIDVISKMKVEAIATAEKYEAAKVTRDLYQKLCKLI